MFISLISEFRSRMEEDGDLGIPPKKVFCNQTFFRSNFFHHHLLQPLVYLFSIRPIIFGVHACTCFLRIFNCNSAVSDGGESQIIRVFLSKRKVKNCNSSCISQLSMVSENITIFLSDMGNKISSHILPCIFFLIVIVVIGLKIWIIKKLQHINRTTVTYDTRILDIEAGTSGMAQNQINMNPQPQPIETLV